MALYTRAGDWERGPVNRGLARVISVEETELHLFLCARDNISKLMELVIINHDPYQLRKLSTHSLCQHHNNIFL